MGVHIYYPIFGHAQNRQGIQIRAARGEVFCARLVQWFSDESIDQSTVPSVYVGKDLFHHVLRIFTLGIVGSS